MKPSSDIALFTTTLPFPVLVSLILFLTAKAYADAVTTGGSGLALCRHLDRELGDVGLSQAGARGGASCDPGRGLCGPEAVRSRENVAREGVGYNLRP
jgi:hypothetical protein